MLNLTVDDLVFWICSVPAYSMGAFFLLGAAVVFSKVMRAYPSCVERRYLAFLSVYLVIAYPVKHIFMRVGGTGEPLTFLVIAIFILLLTTGVFLGSATRRGGGGGARNQRVGGGERPVRLSALTHITLVGMAIALSLFAADMVTTHGYGILSRHAVDTEPMVAGIVVRIQDRIVPLTMMSLLLISVISKKKNLYIVTTAILLLAHFGLDAATRLSKGSMLTGVVIVYLALGQMADRRRKVVVFVVGIVALAVPFAYSSINYLRTGELLGIGLALGHLYDRLVGAKQLGDILFYTLGTESNPLILRGGGIQPDTFYTTEILGHFGMHADATGLFGYFILEYGLVLSFLMVAIFGFCFGVILRLVYESRNVYARVVLLALFVLETLSFMTDGNTSLFALNASNFRKVLAMMVFAFLLIVFLNMTGRSKGSRCGTRGCLRGKAERWVQMAPTSKGMVGGPGKLG